MTVELFLRDKEGIDILKNLHFEPAHHKTFKRLITEKGFTVLRQLYKKEELLLMSVQGPLSVAERKIIEDLSICQRFPICYVGSFPKEVYD